LLIRKLKTKKRKQKSRHGTHNKEHLTKEGLLKLVSLKALMNKGLTDELKAGFPDLVSENELRIPDLTLPAPQPSSLVERRAQNLILDPN